MHFFVQTRCTIQVKKWYTTISDLSAQQSDLSPQLRCINKKTNEPRCDLFVLRFNVPVNNFSVMSGRSHRLLGFNQYCRELMCLFQGHNTVTLVWIEHMTSRFGVRRSNTGPPRSLVCYEKINNVVFEQVRQKPSCTSTEDS